MVKGFRIQYLATSGTGRQEPVTHRLAFEIGLR
jgi:hypothetical protein